MFRPRRPRRRVAQRLRPTSWSNRRRAFQPRRRRLWLRQNPPSEPAVTLKDLGLLEPESALYDAEQDVYFVSSINGKPGDADANGFISKIGPDGKVLDLKWVDGTKKATALNAPKGLGIAGGVLYVADLTFVRMFDAKTGAPKGKIAIPGATFLNDITTSADGTVYVSDSGIKFGKDGVEPTGSDSVYELKAGHAKKLIADKDLGHPNGLIADDKGGVWVVTFGSGELYYVGKDGKKDATQKLPSGSLDGIVKLADGTVLVSSWESSSVLRGTPGGTFTSILPNLKSPADIGYDTKRDIVLIPQMQLNTLELQKLPGGAPVPAAAAAPAPVPVTPPLAAPAPSPAANAKTPAAPTTPVAAPAAQRRRRRQQDCGD